MRKSICVSIISLLMFVLFSCNKDSLKTPSMLQNLQANKYFETEIFTNHLNIYGKWKLFDISGGFAGTGYEMNFDILEVKEYGIYGFVENDTLLEYGKIMPALQLANEIGLKVELEKDALSNNFFNERQLYVEFNGNDTLHLNSPCCDSYNYHFVRIK